MDECGVKTRPASGTMVQIAVSMAGADLAHLGNVFSALKASGCGAVHLEVRDGHFASDVAMGPPVIQSIRKTWADLWIDVHLLVERPERYFEEFRAAGADRVLIHPESTPRLGFALQLAAHEGIRAGVVMPPAIPVEVVEGVLEGLDAVVVLGAEPDEDAPVWSRQATRKLRSLSERKNSGGLQYKLQAKLADRTHAAEIRAAGADVLVVSAGSILADGMAVFTGTRD